MLWNKFRIFRRMVVPLLAIGCLLTISCRKNGGTGAAVLAKGNRHLGAHLSAAADGDYGAAYAKARTAGIDCIPLTLQWSAMESGGVYDQAGLLAELNGFYAGQPVSLSVCVSPFAADRRDMPADLMNTAFDDALMIARFNTLLDTIHTGLGNLPLSYLLLGNEADLYLTAHSNEWNAYGVFCQAVRRHALMLWGTELKVGAETTLGAAIGAQSAPVRALQDSMDLLCLTYYPLRADFFMEPVAQTRADLAALFSLYPTRAVMFQECGYATGAACGGTDSAQADFVHTIFKIWDEQHDRMPYIAFLWLNDLSQQQAETVTADYGITGSPAAAAFTEYIRTLGLCSYAGSSKPGFIALQREALARGWSD